MPSGLKSSEREGRNQREGNRWFQCLSIWEGVGAACRLLEPCKELAFGSVMLVAAPLALFRIPLVVCPYVAAAGA